jgi:transposase-like protein
VIPIDLDDAMASRRRLRFSARGLPETIQYFSDPAVCLDIVSQARWADGPACPRCDSQKLSFLKTRGLWTCLACRKQFSVKVGTIFEDSAICLGKWLTATWLVANHPGGSSYSNARDLGVTQRTAWFMLHRIRYAMQEGMLGNPGHFAGAQACWAARTGGGSSLLTLERTQPDDQKAADTPRTAKPPGYDKLMTLLKHVLNAPPLKRNK